MYKILSGFQPVIERQYCVSVCVSLSHIYICVCVCVGGGGGWCSQILEIAKLHTS